MSGKGYSTKRTTDETGTLRNVNKAGSEKDSQQTTHSLDRGENKEVTIGDGGSCVSGLHL